MNVCVIMSTYNGSKYLGEQLDSIFSQKINGNVIVYIRDDASNDNTLDIIRQRSEYKENKIILNIGENHGPASSFLEAINLAPKADYYAFCDQDDVWKENKLNAAIGVLKANSGPAMWISNFDVVDQNLNLIKKNALNKPELNQLKVLFYNNVPGCTMVFNSKLMVELRKMKIVTVRMHDIMALNIAVLTGEVYYENESYILYRQHDTNAVGYTNNKKFSFEWIKEKIKLILEKEEYSMQEYASAIEENFGEFLDVSLKEEYTLIRHYKKRANRFILLNKSYTKNSLNRTTISIRMKILLGAM